MFAVFQFDELPFNFEYAIFEQMAKYANIYKNSTWYFVDFFSNESYCEKWRIVKGEGSVSHKKVFRISADQFYDTVTQEDNSLNELMRKLPEAISDYCELRECTILT